MAQKNTTPRLTPGNIVYLYGLLCDAIGTGKQTFITHIEAALEEERLGAEDLGFASTQELLEALGDAVKLTVFKGGRVYATVLCRPEWDAALAASSGPSKQEQAAKGNKPWKRKKGDKAIKPARPKRVKRDADPTPAQPASTEPSKDAEPKEAPEPKPTRRPDTAASTGNEADDEPSSKTASSARAKDEPQAAPAATGLRNENFSLEEDSEEDNAHDEAAFAPEPIVEKPSPTIEAPAVSVTVTYDPYTGIDRETVLASTPGRRLPSQGDPFIGQPAPIEDIESAVEGAAPAIQAERDAAARRAVDATAAGPAVSQPDPAAAPEPEQVPAPVPAIASQPACAPAPASAQGSAAMNAVEAEKAPRPKPLPEGLPTDFTEDVYCPGDLLHKLTMAYPYGADVLGIVGEYFHIACDARTIEANRRRATFPVRYLSERQRKTLIVRIVRRAESAAGASWAVEAVEEPSEN